MPMRGGDTMGSGHTLEAPLLHRSLKSFIGGNSLYIDKLAHSEVPWTNHEPFWQDVFRPDLKFPEVPLVWDISPHEMAHHGFFHPLYFLLSNTNLQRIYSILLQSLHLCNLTSIQVDNSEAVPLTPLVCSSYHSYFVSKSPCPFTSPIVVLLNLSTLVESSVYQRLHILRLVN